MLASGKVVALLGGGMNTEYITYYADDATLAHIAELERQLAEQVAYGEKLREALELWETAETYGKGFGRTPDSKEATEYAWQTAREMRNQVLFLTPAQSLDEVRKDDVAMLLWVLWHHQGGNSDVGQPIRKHLGIGRFDHLAEAQVAEAKRIEATSGQWNRRGYGL